MFHWFSLIFHRYSIGFPLIFHRFSIDFHWCSCIFHGMFHGMFHGIFQTHLSDPSFRASVPCLVEFLLLLQRHLAVQQQLLARVEGVLPVLDSRDVDGADRCCPSSLTNSPGGNPRKTIGTCGFHGIHRWFMIAKLVCNLVNCMVYGCLWWI